MRTSQLIAVVVTVLLLGCTAQAADVPAADTINPTFPAAPRLATTAADLAAVKAAADFDSVRDAAVRAAAPLVEQPVPLPNGYGSWIFYYACPDEGSTLRPVSLTEHQCPTCKKTYTDDRTVAAYRCQQHHDIEYAAVKLGWAYAYTGDDKYAAQVRRILVHLADQYASYPDRLDRWGRTGMFAPLGGRRYVQTLDEAVGITRLAPAYDLTRMSPVWSDADRKHVEEDFFRATATSMLRFRQKHNHQTWYNAGLLHIASVLGDADLVRNVLTMKEGVYDQLNTLIGDDGLWLEGTMSYHNYALQAMLQIGDAARRVNAPVHDHPKFKAMILGPLRAAYPNGQYPAINDSDPGNVGMFNYAFAWGWKVYKEPVFAQALAGGNADKLRDMLGPDAQPSPAITESEVLHDSGLAILREGEGGDMACVFLDFGPHGGGHGHFDKLNLMLYANGREWLLDPGRITYSHKEYMTWVKTTAAHNTVAVDQRDQAPHTGELLWLKTGDGWSATALRSTGAYSGVTLTRYVLLTPTLLVDWFDVEADRKHTFDWFAHSVADSITPMPPANVPGAAEPPAVAMPGNVMGNGHGYQHLTSAKKHPALPGKAFDFKAGNLLLRVWPDDEATTTFTANGIGYSTSQMTPTLIRRRDGNATSFVTVFDLSGDGGLVTGMSIDKAKRSVMVNIPGGRMHVTFTDDGASFDVDPR